MKNILTLTGLLPALVMATLFMGCASDESDSRSPSATCTVTPTAVANTAYEDLCIPEAGPARFIVIEGAQTNGNFTSIVLLLGDDDATGQTRSYNPVAGQATVTLYQHTATPDSEMPPISGTSFKVGDTTSVSTSTRFTGYIGSPATVCLQWSEGASPEFLVWANGQGTPAADCTDPATLQAGNTILTKSNWPVTDAIANQMPRISFASSASVNRVTVSSVPPVAP